MIMTKANFREILNICTQAWDNILPQETSALRCYSTSEDVITSYANNLH